MVRASQAPIYGRGEEMSRLLGSLRAAVSERRGGLATMHRRRRHRQVAPVRGAGRGGQRANRSANVVELRVREPIEGDADGNLRALLGRCFALPVEKPADRGEALLAELGPQLWPAAALTLGWMAPDEPELRTLAAAPGVLRATVSRSVGQALRLRAQDRPLVVILDDAHHADDATLEALEYATMPEADVPLWVCVAARPSLAQMKPSWGERSGDHLRLELGPLAPEASTELARRLLLPLEHIPAAALETLVAGTYGNPFLLSELYAASSATASSAAIRRPASISSPPTSWRRLPDLAVTDWLAEREISGLPPELIAHARLCALLGSDFIGGRGRRRDVRDGAKRGRPDQGDPDLRLDPHVATRQLVSMGLFKRQRGGRAAFRHTLLRGVGREVRIGPAARRDPRGGVPLLSRATRHRRRRAPAAARVSTPRRRGLPGRGGAGVPGPRRPRAPPPRYVEAESLYSRVAGPARRGRAVRQRMVALRGRGFMRYRMSRHDAVDDLTGGAGGRAVAGGS